MHKDHIYIHIGRKHAGTQALHPHTRPPAATPRQTRTLDRSQSTVSQHQDTTLAAGARDAGGKESTAPTWQTFASLYAGDHTHTTAQSFPYHHHAPFYALYIPTMHTAFTCRCTLRWRRCPHLQNQTAKTLRRCQQRWRFYQSGLWHHPRPVLFQTIAPA